jgi:hypothetical protein
LATIAAGVDALQALISGARVSNSYTGTTAARVRGRAEQAIIAGVRVVGGYAGTAAIAGIVRAGVPIGASIANVGCILAFVAAIAGIVRTGVAIIAIPGVLAFDAGIRPFVTNVRTRSPVYAA